MTTIPTLPAAPLRTQEPSVFNANVEAWVQALPAWTVAANALGGEVSANTAAAAASATAAAGSATTASTHATNAGNSASSAAASSSTASGFATAAGTSATNAANSATAAGTSATNAANSATAAGTSATNAATSATNAGNSATNAANSATAANTSATNAANAAALARATGNGVNVTLDLSSTADADPGAGKVRPNNAALTSATFLYLDNVDNYGNAIGAWADTFDDSTNTVKGQLIVKNSANDALAIFNITGSVVVGTGYRKIPVSYVGGSGTFANNAVLGFSFARVGNAGTNGTNGVDGQGLLNFTAASGAFSFANADKSKIFRATGTFTIGSATPATLGAGWYAFVENAGTGVITGPSADAGSGAVSTTINPGDILLYQCDGTTLRSFVIRLGRYWRFSTTTLNGATEYNIALPTVGCNVLIETLDCSHNGGSSQTMCWSPSFNNGVSYPTGITGGAVVGNAQFCYGKLLIPGANHQTQVVLGNLGHIDFGGVISVTVNSSSGVTMMRNTQGPMSHIKLYWSASAAFDGGTCNVWVD